jgi:hypothetical protein
MNDCNEKLFSLYLAIINIVRKQVEEVEDEEEDYY